MASITESLPPELLSRIFSYLSGDQNHISASRLVCWTFKKLSSPFLITRVVLAKRLDAIIRIREICEHPYFRRQVTELVWDSSWFNQLDDWSEYVGDCRDAPRRFANPHWRQAEQRSLARWQRLDDMLHDDQTMVPTDTTGSTVVDKGPNLALPTSRRPVAAEEEYVDVANMEDQDIGRAYRAGLPKGFQDYCDYMDAQEQIEQKDIMKSTLAHAFSRLPKLRTLTFADYRHLAKRGENYDASCRRLFGNTLEPMYFQDGGFSEFLSSAVAVAPEARIESINTSAHIFEDSHTFDTVQEDARDPLYIPANQLLDALVSARKVSGFDKNLGHLRHLHLPIATHSDRISISTKALIHILSPNTSTLTHLVLDVQPAYDDLDPYSKPEGPTPFDEVLAPLTFERLRAVDLRRWYLPGLAFTAFLQRHSHTLREIRLVCCLLESDALSMAEWGATHLHLNGIELIPSPWWDGGSGSEESVPALHSQKSTDCTAQKSELIPGHESIWLSGRCNSIERDNLKAKDWDTVGRDKWWLQSRKQG